LNITPEKYLSAPSLLLLPFPQQPLPQSPPNEIGSQQWQCWGQAMEAETEAAAGAHNNQPTDGSNSNRKSIRGAAAAMAAAVAAAVVTVAMVWQRRRCRQLQW